MGKAGHLDISQTASITLRLAVGSQPAHPACNPIKYGDIADLTRAVRVVTPAGILITRPVPSASTGPSVREMILGSEGRLGIITEATVHVHRIPERRQIYGYLFRDWRQGIQAMTAIAKSDATPS